MSAMEEGKFSISLIVQAVGHIKEIDGDIEKQLEQDEEDEYNIQSLRTEAHVCLMIKNLDNSIVVSDEERAVGEAVPTV